MRRDAGKPNHKGVKRCVTGKKISTKAQAKKEARYMKYNKKLPGMRVVAYSCHQCGHWHVGNDQE